MRKRLMTSIAVASVFLSASPASASHGQPAYRTYLYSDSTRTTVVGQIEPYCGYWGTQYYLLGTYSQYSGPDELVGYCLDGDWELL